MKIAVRTELNKNKTVKKAPRKNKLLKKQKLRVKTNKQKIKR